MEDLRAESSTEHVTVAVPNFADVNDAQDAVRPSILDLGARQFTSPSTSAPPLAPIRFETALLEDSSDEDTDDFTSTQTEHTPAAPSRSASSPTAASASVPPTGPRFPNWRPGTNVRSILPCDLPPTRGDIFCQCLCHADISLAEDDEFDEESSYTPPGFDDNLHCRLLLYTRPHEFVSSVLFC